MLVPAVLAAPTLISCASAPKRAAGAPDAPARTPRIAISGCGGRGADNLGDLLGAGAEMVALCDVSHAALDAGVARVAQSSPGAAPRAFTDLRELFARRGELALDGVLVSTPDHTHAVATALALRAGLAAYCE